MTGKSIACMTQGNGIAPKSLNEERTICVGDAGVLLGDIGIGEHPVIARQAPDRKSGSPHDPPSLRAERGSLGTYDF